MTTDPERIAEALKTRLLTTPMRALSVKQPWAGLIIASHPIYQNQGIKPIENRGWRVGYTGRLAICATKTPENRDEFDYAREKCARLGVEFPEELCSINASCIGSVDLQGMIYMQNGKFFTDHPKQVEWLSLRRAREFWDVHQFGWVMASPLPVTPFKVTGQLGLFWVDFPL